MTLDLTRQCTHEQGDSDCALHVTCSECGASIDHQRVVQHRKALIAEIEKLRAAIDQANTDRDEAWDDRDAQVEAKKRMVAAVLADVDVETSRLRRLLRDATCPFDSTAESRAELRKREGL